MNTHSCSAQTNDGENLKHLAGNLYPDWNSRYPTSYFGKPLNLGKMIVMVGVRRLTLTLMLLMLNDRVNRSLYKRFLHKCNHDNAIPA